MKHATYKGWLTQYDREYHTVTWLDCETSVDDGAKLVTQLKCRVCTKFKERIAGRKNYSEKWITGANSVRTTNLVDHAKSEQHAHAMNLLRKERAQAQGAPATVYAPIAQSLHTLSDEELKKVRKKFDVAYFVATEQLAFRKYPQICALEMKHGVDLGSSYLNEKSCREFVHYLAESKQQDLNTTLSKAMFFSLMMDGSTDSSNADNELLLVLWCDIDDEDERIHTRISYLSVHKPPHTTAAGLFQSLEYGLQCLGIQSVSKEECSKLVGLATDGASANIAANGLKGLVEKELDWIFWMWCLAHRLELALKDALHGTTFDLLDEMLLRLYYLYEKSPKKCAELETIVDDLKEAFHLNDEGAGIRPVRACGTRWVSHKLSAMKRVINKFGAYTAHLTTLSVDSSVKTVDRAKFRGYLNKWTNAKYLLGCALFADLLLPYSIFSKSMQADEMDILGALTNLLRSIKETNKLNTKPLEQWPTYAAMLNKITFDDEGEAVYQGQVLKRFSEAKSFFQTHHQEYCKCVTERIRTRLSWSDLQLFRDIITMLSTHGWQKLIDDQSDSDEDGEDPFKAIDQLTERFKFPLEKAGADLSEMRSEFEAMISYATQFISLATMEYQSVWWHLFHAPNKSEWSNVLILANLLFSLPVSNGKLERTFSQVNLIKSTKRSSLSTDALSDLLVVNADKSSLKEFSPDSAIDLWWNAKTRRPTQGPRASYKKSAPQDQDCGADEEPEMLLDDWDEWIINT